MSGELFDPRGTLEVSYRTQLRAEEERRYKSNPHMQIGDSVATHVCLALRLLSGAMPALKLEFPDENLLLLYPELFHHDDDELGKTGDIATFTKTRQQAESALSESEGAMAGLSDAQRFYMMNYVREFSEQETLRARLAKVFDRLASNLKVIDEIDGIIQPDHAKLTIEYVKELLGISETTNALIHAQVEWILELRQQLLQENSDPVRRRMLSEDLSTFRANREKAYIPIDKYYG